MFTLAAVFLLSLSASIRETVQSTCKNFVTCPCGQTTYNVTICLENLYTTDMCQKFLGCKSCRNGHLGCLECAEGFEGTECLKNSKRKKRRISSYHPRSNFKLPITQFLNPSVYNAKNPVSMQTGLSTDPAKEILDVVYKRRSRIVRQTAEGRNCPDPGFVKNGIRKNDDGSDETRVRTFQDGEALLFTCIGLNSILQGESFSDCVDGQWTNPVPHCVNPNAPTVRKCSDPGFIQNGFRINTDGSDEDRVRNFEDGEALLFSCNGIEYTFEGSPILDCKDGEWSHQLPHCFSFSGDECDDPGFVTNGYRKNDDGSDSNTARRFASGETASFICSPEYTLKGSSFTVCDNGRWNEPLPLCVGNEVVDTVGCDDPGIVIHSTVNAVPPTTSHRRTSTTDVEIYPEGTTLTYSCDKAGLVLLGTETIICGPDGAWSADPPVCSIECGIQVIQPKPTTTNRLFNGYKASPGEWPWVVAIAVKSRSSTEIVCGGALINSRTVLTAAHCVDANSFTLYFGKTHRYNTNDNISIIEIRQSREIIRHKEYSSLTYENDIALIKFAPRIRFTDYIRPICLPSKESMATHLMTGQHGIVTGWGVNEQSLLADDLMTVRLPVLTHDECEASFSTTQLPFTENMFCTGFGANNQTTCNGDSGSPLSFKDSDGRYVVEGVVSFGEIGQCGREGKYPGFTKIGNYAQWIRRNERGSGGGRWSGD